MTKETSETGLTEPNEVEPSKMFTGSFQVQPNKGPLATELEAVNPSTDKFLLETYEKLKQLEEDIQKRKAKEATLMAQRTQELQNIETRTSQRSGQQRRNGSEEPGAQKAQICFENSPSPMGGPLTQN